VRLLDVNPRLRGLHLVPQALSRVVRQAGDVESIAEAVEAGAVPTLMRLLQQAQPAPAELFARQMAVLSLVSLAHGGGAAVARALAASGFAAHVVQLLQVADPWLGKNGNAPSKGILGSRIGGAPCLPPAPWRIACLPGRLQAATDSGAGRGLARGSTRLG
jgi:hypothetical protein